MALRVSGRGERRIWALSKCDAAKPANPNPKSQEEDGCRHISTYCIKSSKTLAMLHAPKKPWFHPLVPPIHLRFLISFLVLIESHPSIDLPILLKKTTDESFPLLGEPLYSEVHEGLCVNGWPLSPQKLPPGNPVVVDCTCEFPRVKDFTARLPYRCIPTPTRAAIWNSEKKRAVAPALLGALGKDVAGEGNSPEIDREMGIKADWKQRPER
ncbi:hypothetical protein E2542_SST08746 [Spatholobus suberectus]|nr:hypothetical protein E2542_SST08746 [Spatholobus suberectus]